MQLLYTDSNNITSQGSYSSTAKDSDRLRCDAVLLGVWFLVFQRIAVSSSLGSTSWTTCDHDDEGAMIFLTCWNYRCSDRTSQHYNFGVLHLVVQAAG